MDVQRGCTGKQAYLSKAHAKQVARSMSARHHEPFHLYRCPACGYHHVGHVVPMAVRRAIRTAAADGPGPAPDRWAGMTPDPAIHA